ncbi:hypothetical protein [Microbacterium gorillae]|uniref:hypothetical protein n=1 Tax=Microbacterium gorillae TaxID=1231063 RepID=UPI0005918480|nr:hypothetical protein [Microbacterium gorillae]
MKTWIVRFVSLYVFDVLVLLVIGWTMPAVRVGWHALWAAVILTAATVWVKPAIGGWFRSLAERGGSTRSTGARKVTEYAIVFVVALVVWVLTVLLSGVDVRGWFWGYILPPVILLIAWLIYDVIDDAVEKRTGEVYDRAAARLGGAGSTPAATSEQPTPQQRTAQAEGRRELNDGLTDEERKMFDDLS